MLAVLIFVESCQMTAQGFDWECLRLQFACMHRSKGPCELCYLQWYDQNFASHSCTIGLWLSSRGDRENTNIAEDLVWTYHVGALETHSNLL